MKERPISIAILAMGGQGGGTLSNWIVSVAESAGYAAQLRGHLRWSTGSRIEGWCVPYRLWS